MREVLTSNWGQLFRGWERAVADKDGYRVNDAAPATMHRAGFRALLTSFGILGTCLKEAPEFSTRRRRVAKRS